MTAESHLGGILHPTDTTFQSAKPYEGTFCVLCGAGLSDGQGNGVGLTVPTVPAVLRGTMERHTNDPSRGTFVLCSGWGSALVPGNRQVAVAGTSFCTKGGKQMRILGKNGDDAYPAQMCASASEELPP
jgi:hypothetical protein